MDDLSLQLMRRIGVAPFLTWPHPPASIRPAALARTLKVSTDTVKRRIEEMRGQRVFHGYMVFPNPRLFGLQMASLHFRMGEAARRQVDRDDVAAVEGVLGVFDMVGGDRCIDVAFGDDAARGLQEERLTELLGTAPSHFVDYAAPRPSVEMSALDWRLVQALRSAPDVALETAAERTGVSVRTAKRRVDRMVAGGCIDTIGLFDPGAVPGHLLVDLLFYLAKGAGRAELRAILDAFRHRWVAQWSPPDHELGHLALVVVAASAREVEDLRREAESLVGVERCDALIVEGAVEHWHWIDGLVAERAAPAAPDVLGPVAAAAPAPKRQR